MTDEIPGRSVEACPRCGMHRLAIVEPPQLVDRGAQPLDAIYALSRTGSDPVVPGIECLSCGAVWSDLAAFRADSRGDPDHDPGA